jgi:4'-phosphopantetheinyl transferase
VIAVILLTAERELNETEYSTLLAAVPPEKRARINRLRGSWAAQNTLLGDTIVRREISIKTGIPAAQLVFKTNEYGKPFFNDEIHFSISHSGNAITAALDTLPVGIDIETIKPCPNPGIERKIMKRFFTPEEQAYITQPDRETSGRFYEIWTMKESYIKKEGKGLALPLRSFNVLSLKDGSFFFKIPLTGMAGHVCASHNIKPEYTLLTIHNFLTDYASKSKLVL